MSGKRVASNPLAVLGWLLVVGVGTLTAQTYTASQQPTAKTWAVVIGVSKYPKLGGGQQLKFADSDAVAFADAIKKMGATPETVRLLVNQQATNAAIKDAIGNFLARYPAEEDIVCIYFSGHGYVEKGFNEPYLLGYDADLNAPYSTALSLTELSYALSRRIKARRILVIGDAVREEFFKAEGEERANSITFSKSFLQLAEWRAGIAVMLANSEGEYSREGQRWQSHGVFTHYLLEAMRGGADSNRDGLTSADESFDFLGVRLAADTAKKQNPARSGGAMSQIILAKQSAAVAQTSASGQSPLDGRTPPQPSSGAATTSSASSSTPPPAPTQTAAAPPPAASATATTTSTTATAPPPVANPPTSPTRTEIASISNATVGGATTAPTTGTPKPTPPAAATVSTTAPTTSSTTPPTTPTTTPPTTKPPTAKTAAPPTTRAISSGSPKVESSVGTPAAIGATPLANPPAPVRTPPAVSTVSTGGANTTPATESVTTAVPVTAAAAPPSPLLLEFEAALADGRLLEPKDSCAWDIYQRLAQQPGASADAARFKPRLADALVREGKAIVTGDLRGDNIAARVEEFRRAGQIFVRARTLTGESQEVTALEKLSAAQALVALQFYDEAERALSQLPRSAATENALGLVHFGKLDTWKAERAFKNAIELEPAAAAPHYNLGLLYRSQKNEAALVEFESAAKLAERNEAMWLALGDEYFDQGKWQAAAAAYGKAIALKPMDDTLHTKLGHALYSQGLRDEANKAYQRAKELRARQ